MHNIDLHRFDVFRVSDWAHRPWHVSDNAPLDVMRWFSASDGSAGQCPACGIAFYDSQTVASRMEEHSRYCKPLHHLTAAALLSGNTLPTITDAK